MPNRAEPPILLVEDCPEDLEAFRRGLRSARWDHPLHHCWTGDEALDYLHRRGPYASPDSSPRPGVIFLDLNLPGTHGREVLWEIKRQEELRTIPVIVLTTSTAAGDVESCYRAGGNCYIPKPLDGTGLGGVLGRVREFWCETVLLPRSE